MDYKKTFIRYLDSKGVKYQDIDSETVRVGYKAENASFGVYVSFDEDGERYVHFSCLDLPSYSKDKLAAGLITCNEMNRQYRWAKFYLDNDMDIIVDCDAIVDIDSVGEECLQLVRRMVNICDDAYPVFMKSKWS